MNTQNLKNHVDSIAQGVLFRGFEKPAEPKIIEGSVYFDTRLDAMQMYSKGEWVPIYNDRSPSGPRMITSPLLKEGLCSCCGCPDSGQFKCKKCQTILRWYA